MLWCHLKGKKLDLLSEGVSISLSTPLNRGQPIHQKEAIFSKSVLEQFDLKLQKELGNETWVESSTNKVWCHQLSSYSSIRRHRLMSSMLPFCLLIPANSFWIDHYVAGLPVPHLPASLLRAECEKTPITHSALGVKMGVATRRPSRSLTMQPHCKVWLQGNTFLTHRSCFGSSAGQAVFLKLS